MVYEITELQYLTTVSSKYTVWHNHSIYGTCSIENYIIRITRVNSVIYAFRWRYTLCIVLSNTVFILCVTYRQYYMYLNCIVEVFLITSTNQTSNFNPVELSSQSQPWNTHHDIGIAAGTSSEKYYQNANFASNIRELCKQYKVLSNEGPLHYFITSALQGFSIEMRSCTSKKIWCIYTVCVYSTYSTYCT